MHFPRCHKKSGEFIYMNAPDFCFKIFILLETHLHILTLCFLCLEEWFLYRMHVVRYNAAREYNKLRIVRVDIRIVQSAGCLQMLFHIGNRDYL